MALLRSEPDKYDPLGAYLAARPKQQHVVRLTFREVEDILGSALPRFAYDASARWWWPEEPDAPQARAWLDAGFGLSSLDYPAEPDFPGEVAFERGLHKWPGIGVSSCEFGRLPGAERLRQLALGYLQAAKKLCIGLGESPGELTWPNAAVVCFCYRHAVELFLKSCILHRQPVEKCSHDISRLREQYSRLYPGPAFCFQTQYDKRLEDLEELLGHQLDREDFERKHDQLYRYLSDKQGQSPKASYGFAPGAWLSKIERLEGDVDRIWDEIRNQDSSAEQGAAADRGH